MNRYRFIAVEQAHHLVVHLCRALGVSRSGFYAWQQRPPSRRAQQDAVLTERIRGIHDASHCTYGAPRVQAELRGRGTRVGRKRVARLMRKAGLVGRCPKRFRRTTRPSLDPVVQPPDLVRRQFRPAAPNLLWVADITYVRTWEGWLYLAVIVDAYSRTVVGWSMADHLRTELATAALDLALTSRRPAPGLVHHSDRGGQYVSAAYVERLAAVGAASSVGRPGVCWDNAVAESFFATLKIELVYRAVWPTRQQARSAIFAYIQGFYNTRRRHSTLGYLSPAEYEARAGAATLAA